MSGRRRQRDGLSGAATSGAAPLRPCWLPALRADAALAEPGGDELVELAGALDLRPVAALREEVRVGVRDRVHELPGAADGELAEWDLPTLALPVKNLHVRLRGIVPAGTDAVIIDTPPLDEQAGIVYSALRAASIVLVTMAPTMMEFERLADVWDAIDQTEALRAEPAQVAILLNRVNAHHLAMLPELLAAHRKLDRALDGALGVEDGDDQYARQRALFATYQRLTQERGTA